MHRQDVIDGPGKDLNCGNNMTPGKTCARKKARMWLKEAQFHIEEMLG